MCALLCRCICRPGMKRGWLPTTFGCNGRESSRLIWVWLGQRSYYFPLDHQAEDTQPSAARAYTNTHISIISLRGQLQALPGLVNTHTQPFISTWTCTHYTVLLDQQGVTERQILLLAASTENDRRGTQTMFPSTCFMSILNEDVKNYENKKMTLYANPTPRRKKVVNLYDCINLVFHSLLKKLTQLNSILSQVKNGSMYNSLWDQKCHFFKHFFFQVNFIIL